MAFSPDGKTIAAGYGAGGGGGVVLWDVDLESWQQRLAESPIATSPGAEWRQYFPEEPYRATFPDLPIPPEIPSQQRKNSR